ncbi:MAG TPA: Lrp/AsnC family transcriptional regulator [Candidatus Thermoplasmatota archaeon]|nr:Lrp/AsnC family transcriptional regulator [Candidatus Thermoplasmatota archaeon]
MDGLDLDILRAMGLQPFQGGARPPDRLRPSRIARELGVSADTVTARIERMQDEGVIRGFEVYPNFGHLGVTATTYHFLVGDRRAKARRLEDVRNVEGVVGIFDFVGSAVCVDLAYRHPRELERKVELVARLLGAQTLPHACFDYAPPPVARPLAGLDWRIVRALRGRARRSPEEVAAELGVSARTIRRRVERMLADGSIDIVPDVATARMSGYVIFEVLITLRGAVGDPHALPAPLARVFEGALYSAWPVPGRAARPCLTLMLAARSVAELDDMRRAAEALPEVDDVEVLIPAGRFGRSEWIDEAIEARIHEALPAAPEPS